MDICSTIHVVRLLIANQIIKKCKKISLNALKYNRGFDFRWNCKPIAAFGMLVQYDADRSDTYRTRRSTLECDSLKIKFHIRLDSQCACCILINILASSYDGRKDQSHTIEESMSHYLIQLCFNSNMVQRVVLMDDNYFHALGTFNCKSPGEKKHI